MRFDSSAGMMHFESTMERLSKELENSGFRTSERKGEATWCLFRVSCFEAARLIRNDRCDVRQAQTPSSTQLDLPGRRCSWTTSILTNCCKDLTSSTKPSEASTCSAQAWKRSAMRSTCTTSILWVNKSRDMPGIRTQTASRDPQLNQVDLKRFILRSRLERCLRLLWRAREQLQMGATEERTVGTCRNTSTTLRQRC